MLMIFSTRNQKQCVKKTIHLQEKAALVRFILGTIRNYTTHPQRLKQVQNKWLMVVLGSKVQR